MSMKNLFFSILLFLVLTTCLSQTNTTIYTQGVCECMDSTGGVQKSMIDCFSKSIERNKMLFEQSVRERGDTSDSGISRLFDKLLFDVQIDLVGTCNSFFKYTDSLNRLRYKNVNKDSLQSALLSLNRLDTSKKDRNYYTAKADVFIRLGEYESALRIADSLLTNDSRDEVGLLLKVLVLDRKEDFEHSASLYHKLVEITMKDAYRLLAALAERRIREAKISSQ